MSLALRVGRILVLAAAVLVAMLLAAPAAMAADGVGLWGRTNDLVITLWAFGVMGFFTLLVILLSIAQIRAESRRERTRAEIERARRG